MLSFAWPKLSTGIVSLGFVLCVAATGCSDFGPMDVTSSYGPGFRFSERIHTYTWAPGSEKTTGPGRPLNPEVDTLIRQTVEKHLAAKGYTQAVSTAPDFWIDYRVARELRGDPYVGVGFPAYSEGSIILYVLNPATRQLSWRGCVAARMDESAPPDERLKRLDTSVKLILDQMPDYKIK